MKEMIETVEECKNIGCESYPCDNVIDIDGDEVLIAPCVFEIIEELDDDETPSFELKEDEHVAIVRKEGDDYVVVRILDPDD